MLRVWALEACDWAAWGALRRAALEEAPAAFGATHGAAQGAHDSEQRWRARLAALPFNAMATLDGRAVGMVSGCRADAVTAELVSLWVAPHARGRGVGVALVESVYTWAEEDAAARLVLRVYENNRPALLLYERCGFRRLRLIKRRSSGREHSWLLQRPCTGATR